MKKSILLVLMILLCICPYGCTGTTESPELDALISKDEFAVYESEKLILTLDEIEMTDRPRFFFADPYSEYYESKYLGEPFDYRGHDLTTKRGIKIGSSIEDVVIAYTGIEFFIPFTEEEGPSTIEQIATIEKEKRNGQDEYEKTIWFYTDTYFMHDGRALSVSKFNELVKENEWDYYNIQRNMDEYMDAFYELRFAVMGGVVTEISLLDQKEFWRIG